MGHGSPGVAVNRCCRRRQRRRRPRAFWSLTSSTLLPAELSYELYVSLAAGEKNSGVRERVRQVAVGKAREYRLDGLNPATDYQVAVQAVSDKVSSPKISIRAVANHHRIRKRNACNIRRQNS